MNTSTPSLVRAKFMDNLTILEVIFLANIGLASYNNRSQVSSNIATQCQLIPSEHLKTHKYLEYIYGWTEKNNIRLKLFMKVFSFIVINMISNHLEMEI